MELVHIKENDINTVIYLDSDKYYGYKYVSNNLKNIDKSSLNIFKFFFLSKNYTKLPKYQKYEVYLDNETGLKHYYYHHIENFYLLFSNNGTYAINYLNNNNRLTNSKIFNLKNKIIFCTFLGLMLALSNIDKPVTKITNSVNLLLNDYEPSDIEKMINESINLTETEKEYLYNEDFITDVLEIINSSYYEKQKLKKHFNNINIIGYQDTENESLSGYYKVDTPNILYVKNYHEFEDAKKGILGHEFAHLCQTITDYNLITEASADLITKEYFDKDYQFGYSFQVKLLKKLMEIIGSYPIWYYNFTGDFSKIAERILPYLTYEEYKKFLNDLKYDYKDNLINESKYQELDELLNILYYRIYEKDIKDDEIINLIENDDKNLVRYYFNQRMINDENSYYLDYDLGAYETISYKEAIDSAIITAYTISYIEVSKEEAFKIIEDNTSMLRRDIDYHTHNIIISYSRHGNNKYTISGIIDGIKYEEANVDDLVKAGIIDVNYYIIERKNLTGEDYEKHNYKDDELCLIRDMHTIVNEETVEYLVPRKICLPTIKYRYLNNSGYTKNKKITTY